MFSSQRAKIIGWFSSAFLVVPQCGTCLFLIQLLMCVKTCFKHRFGKMATNKIVFCAKDCCASRPCSVSNGASNAKCSPPHSFCAATFRFLFIFQIWSIAIHVWKVEVFRINFDLLIFVLKSFCSNKRLYILTINHPFQCLIRNFSCLSLSVCALSTWTV